MRLLLVVLSFTPNSYGLRAFPTQLFAHRYLVSITTTHKEGLVVGARSMPGNPYDGHTLAEALEQAAILSDVKPEVAIVDRGYKGVAIDGVKIYHPGLRCGITRGLRAMIRRRSAIEPAIGHMKADGKLDRNWLKGALGDALHAVLCGAGHNLRMILRKLRLFPSIGRPTNQRNRRTIRRRGGGRPARSRRSGRTRVRRTDDATSTAS